MSKITEQNIIGEYTGRSVCPESLAKCGRKNRPTKEGDEYIVYSCGFLYDQNLREIFGVTLELKEQWERRGTEFNLYVYIDGDKIVSCKICKYREGGGARPSYNPIKCTKQELAIAQRILEYITK